MFLLGMAVSAVIIGALAKLQRTASRSGRSRHGSRDHRSECDRTFETGTHPNEQRGPCSAQTQVQDAWADFTSGGEAGRLLVVVFIGTMAFNMQDAA